MKKLNITPGEYVYYYSPEGDTVPARIEAVGRKRVKIENFHGRHVWVSPGKIERQEEQNEK